MSPSFLYAFYGACGLLIAGLLIRIWFKNRAARQPQRPAPAAQSRPRPTVPEPVKTATPTATAPIPPPPAPAPVVTAATSAQLVTSGSETSRNYEPYVSASSSTIMRSSVVPTWEDRSLFEHAGVLNKPHHQPMPRVLAADIPGTDESDRTFGGLNSTLASLLPDTPERQEIARKELNAAGYYNPHALENLAALRYALMMLSILVFGGLLLIVPTRLEPLMIMGLVIGPILGWALPMLYVRRRAADRIQEIGRAMPDLLDMLNMCVSQGLTVPEALKRILRDFRNVYPALSEELNIVTEQARINDLHTALESFSRRIDLPEVHSFTSLLIQTERMGTSISEALITYSDTMRESLKQRVDERGNRATFRLLFPTVLCLMPAVYLFLLGPAVNELSKFFTQGGLNSVDTGTQAIQRLNAQRGVNR